LKNSLHVEEMKEQKILGEIGGYHTHTSQKLFPGNEISQHQIDMDHPG
jgi:hypothetical protein